MIARQHHKHDPNCKATVCTPDDIGDEVERIEETITPVLRVFTSMLRQRGGFCHDCSLEIVSLVLMRMGATGILVASSANEEQKQQFSRDIWRIIDRFFDIEQDRSHEDRHE